MKQAKNDKDVNVNMAERECVGADVDEQWKDVKGICLDRSRGYNKFKAYIDVFGVRVNLGSAFPTAADAFNARAHYEANIFGSSYGPLPSFLCDYFGLSMMRAYAAIALCVPLYLELPAPQHSMFPNFVVKTLRDAEMLKMVRNLSDTEVEMLKAAFKVLSPAALAVVCGNVSFSQARKVFGCRYEDIIDSLQRLKVAYPSSVVAGFESKQG